MIIPGFLLSLIMAVLLCWHAVKTGRDSMWLWIILMLQPLGGLVYIALNIVPDLFGGTTARRIGHAARETLDPHREYREAKAACDDTPTVRNQSRLATAAMHMQRYEEAEALYRAAAQGVHADDPALLLGLANALLELHRPADALQVLERLGNDQAHGRTAAAALALGRAYEDLGRIDEADTALQWASQRLPGFEGLARYAAFMARNGRRDEAREAVQEMDKRLAKLKPQFRKEGRAWRDLAAQALGGA
ncbi:tetratricopeptide repeat protein [Phenylobacterium sp.]|uniref:tetratricopeptide repeat protein n=1 Tax=Phenylobacterium sp. TaxID=1871053 RepID=UPI0035655BA7